MTTKLSVNINKFATLRNSRGGNNPNIVEVAKDAEAYGVDGITVHPRPDERHIKYMDVYALKKVVQSELNIEGYPDAAFLQLIADIKPQQVTLVPDAPNVLTSNAGWDTNYNAAFLTETIAKIKGMGCRVSLFLDPNPLMVEGAKACGADRIELYTEAYASNFNSHKENAIKAYAKTAEVAQIAGLGINAGHDLNLDNLQYFAENIPGLLEVSIGHALVCDSLYFGFHNTIQMYKNKLNTNL